MCLILVAHQVTEQLPLIVLANRDEFYNRPTANAAEWTESSDLIAGRDLASGGTWFGARNQRWAAVTNVREGVGDPNSHQKSRGWLVRDYLQEERSPADFLQQSSTEFDDFAGFNLLLGDGKKLWYASNRIMGFKQLPPGVYGLSNHLLDTPWPKVTRGKTNLRKMLGQTPLAQRDAFALLADTELATDDKLPETGIPLEWERALSAIFISTPDYGTRCSTLLTAGPDRHRTLTERRYTNGPQTWQESEFAWTAERSS